MDLPERLCLCHASVHTDPLYLGSRAGQQVSILSTPSTADSPQHECWDFQFYPLPTWQCCKQALAAVVTPNDTSLWLMVCCVEDEQGSMKEVMRDLNRVQPIIMVGSSAVRLVCRQPLTRNSKFPSI